MLAHEVDSQKELRKSFENVERTYGFTNAALFTHNPWSETQASRYKPVFSSFPDDLTERYTRFVHDEVIHGWIPFFLGNEPIRWGSELTKRFDEREVQKSFDEIITYAFSTGLTFGLIFPIFGARGVIGDLKLASNRTIDLSPLEISLFAAMARTLLERFGELEQDRKGPTHLTASTLTLSLRERAILQNLADGMTSVEVSKAIGLSNHTVDWYVTGLQEKFGARNRQNLIALAFRSGVIF